MAFTNAENQARWKARHNAEVECLRNIAHTVARLVRNDIHSDQDAPIIQRLEKALEGVTI
jgi:hypothetical protein